MRQRPAGPKRRRARKGVPKLAGIQAKLENAYSFLEAILENIPNMIFVKDAKDLRFVRFNRAGEELVGLDRSELLGKSDYDLFPKDQADFFTAADRSVLQDGKLLDVPEEPIVTRLKGRRLLHTKKVPIPGLGGEPAFLLGISEDITDLVEIRKKLDERTRELESFSYSVAHDLRAPLRAIEGFTAMVLRASSQELSPPSRQALAKVRAASQRMGELIDALLLLAKLGQQPLQREKVDLGEAARATFHRLQAHEARRRVQFRCATSIVAQGDPALLSAALDNLISNAWKFTRRAKHARIEFGTLRARGEIVFFVRDNGVGYDMAYQSRLFKPFQRLHTDHEFPGTGVGLATVYRVIQRHGGRLWSKARVGHGATFFFTLPR